MAYAAALAQKLRAENDSREPDGFWFPSQLGGCDRKNVLAHAGVEAVPFDDRTLRLFWLGKEIHTALQQSFPYPVIGHELRVRNEEHKVSGRIDTLAEIDGILEAVEYKSVHDKKFSYGDLPENAHILQVGAYLTWPAQDICAECKESESVLARFGPVNNAHHTEQLEYCDVKVLLPIPDRGRLVYWSKNDARIEEFIIDRSDKLSEAVINEFDRLERLYQTYLSTGTLPDALPLATKKVRGKSVMAEDWRVNYCSYKGTGNCCGDIEVEMSDEVRTARGAGSPEVPGLPEDSDSPA